ncbi:hypothetical protein NESM_000111100 [Novymonas esmeraldas]|uniref:Uncharacterized protein n=1 Tax=Novymonas esmeraldas TaxID=1808958 RepID=A0AAW0F4F2_9TRYP
MNIQISGNLSKPTVIFLAGWPDTCDVFRENLMAALAEDYRLVGLTIPGFDDGHPFLQELRDRGRATTLQQSVPPWDSGHRESPSSAAMGSWWRTLLWPLRFLHSASSADAQGSGAPLQSFGLPSRCAALEPFHTSWKGHSFQDLVTLLEIAVDTAMETCNYCPFAASPTSSTAPGGSQNAGGRDESEASHMSTEGSTMAHQSPPRYIQPMLIAHDWGCFLAYELLLSRPGLFSRIVALDIGAYVFDRDAAHVERMCALVSGQERLSKSGTAFPSATWATAEETAAAAAAAGVSGPSLRKPRRADAAPPAMAPVQERPLPLRRATTSSTAAPTSRSFSSAVLHERGGSSLSDGPPSPVTVAHGVVPGARSEAASGLPRSGPSSPATRRSLASQYAIRHRRGAAQPQGADTRKGLMIVLYQFFLIACELVVPHRLACWLISCFTHLSGRPTYAYDPQLVATPTMELLNHTLNAQFFARHPFALENRGALQVPMLLQTQERTAAQSTLAPAAGGGGAAPEVSYGRENGAAHPPPSGWKIMLLPYTERTPHGAGQEQHHTQLKQRGSGVGDTGNVYEGKCGAARMSATSGLTGGYSLHGGSSSRSSSVGLEDALRSPAGQYGGGAGGDRRGAPDGTYVVFSSYTKGAKMVTDEWGSLASGSHGGGDEDRSRFGVGGSSELDPYSSATASAPPVGAADDPLALTGAQSFADRSRAGVGDEDDFLLFGTDGALPAGRGGVDGAGGGHRNGGPGQMEVCKRRIFYQAVVFPPACNGGGGAPSSSRLGDLDNTGPARSSFGSRSTVLGRLRASSRAAAQQRPVVPVRPSPWQSWIYLRYWLGTLLLRSVAFVWWLLGEKQPAPPTAAAVGGGGGGGTKAANSGAATARASSNVMTTAMTTIYRRLPATPSLAADVTTLPGNGDAVLRPKSHAPLVTQRFFVPLPIPILYMYGGEKRIMFHADHWCSYIRHYQRPRDGISDVVEVQGGGHWFFAEKKYQKKVADRVAEFLTAEVNASLSV